MMFDVDMTWERSFSTGDLTINFCESYSSLAFAQKRRYTSKTGKFDSFDAEHMPPPQIDA